MARRSGGCLAALLFLATVNAACSKSAQSYYESGNQYFAQKKYNEAILEYSNAIKKDMKFGDAHYKLAEALKLAGNPQAAFTEYQRAADLLPSNKEAQLSAGTFLLMARQFADAQMRAEKALALDPKYVDALILKANAMAGLGRIDDAIKSVNDAIQLDPSKSQPYMSLGGLQLAKGKTAEAEATLKQAVDLDPKSVNARLALAQFFWATQRQPEAEQSFKAAVELDPKNTLANGALASFYIASGRPSDAEPYFKAVAEATNDWHAWLTLADFYAATKRTDEALARLEIVAKTREAYAEARTRIAAIQYDKGQKAEAHQTLAEVLKQQPTNVRALLLDAQFLIAEKKLDEALDRTKKAVTADPQSAAAQYTLGLIYKGKNDADGAIKAFNETLRLSPRAAGAQAELAGIYMATGSYVSAVQFADQALQNQPDNPQLKLLLVRTLMTQPKPDLARAEAELKPLLAAAPQSAVLQAALGTLLMGKGDLAGSRRAYETALQLDPGSYEAFAGLVRLDVGAKKFTDARARIDARLAKAPDDPAAQLLSARMFVTARDEARRAGDKVRAAAEEARAEQTLLKLIQTDPGTLEAYQILGQLYLEQNNLSAALQKFEELAKRQPKPVGAQTMIGMILQAQGKNEEAKRRYEMVLDLDPRAPVAANNLAWLYAESGETLDKALQLARTAKEVMPDSAPINDTLGWIYVKKQMPALAIPVLTAAVTVTEQRLKTDPAAIQSLSTYLYHLGIAYKDDKDKPNAKANAKAALEKALKLYPNFTGSAEARKALAEIG